MGIFDSIGKVVGGAVGTALLPGVGTAIGSALGGVAGNLAGKGLGEVFSQFTKDPLKALTNPHSLVSTFVDSTLKNMGVPAEFRSLAKMVTDPRSAIENVLTKGLGNAFTPVNVLGQTSKGDHLKSNDLFDTVDTGRYLISASEDKVKVFDKQTNKWTEMNADHLRTSDGDKGHFDKNLTIDLADGTKVTLQKSPQDCHGHSHISAVAVTRGNEGVVMTGLNDGKAGVNTSKVSENGWGIDKAYTDGTVLRAPGSVDDLHYASTNKEIEGGLINIGNLKIGEHNLDGKGGKSQNDAKLPFQPLPFPRPMPPITCFPLPYNPGLDLGKIKDIFDKLPKDPSAGLVDGLKGIIEQAKKLLEGLTGGGKTPTTPAAPGTPGGTPAAPGAGGSKGPGTVNDWIKEDVVKGDKTQAAGDESAPAAKGGDIYARLFAVLAKLQKAMEKKLGQIEQHAAKMDAKGDKAGALDKAGLDKLQFELQQIQNMMNQITTTATNMLKSEHDTRMSIVRNLA